MSTHYRPVARINAYINFQLVTRMAASFHKFSSLASFESTTLFHFRPISMQECAKPNGALQSASYGKQKQAQ
jgi:hypothetical protein